MVKLALVVLLSLVAAFDLYVVRQCGYWSVFPPFEHLYASQIFVDLCVCLGLISVWMVLDWRKQGRPLIGVVPFLLAIVFLGSLGPLLYLLLRGGRGTAPAPGGEPAPAS